MRNFNRPLTYALPVNPVPTRTLVVSDPRKLSFFAEANLTRMGLNRTAGTLGGLGDEAVANTVTSSDGVSLGIGQTVGSFLRSLFDGFVKGGTQSPPPPPLPPPPGPDNTVLGLPAPIAIVGGLALAGGIGYMAYKASKKKR